VHANGRGPGKSRSKRTTRLDTRWRRLPGLLEDAATADDLRTGRRAVLEHRVLDLLDALADLREHGVRIAELGWNRQRQRDLLGHDTVIAKEVTRTLCAQWLAMDEVPITVGTRPLVCALDEQVLDRIGRRVHQLVDHGIAIEEERDANLLGGPEVLPAPPARVHAARDHLVEVLDELRIAAVAVEQHRVMMVRHRGGQHDVDLEPLRSLAEAVDERVVVTSSGRSKN